MIPPSAKAQHRIAKLLARAGVASRREIERMIADGRVTHNGIAVDTPATLLTSLAGIAVDGVAIQAAAPARLFLYHKPAGLLVTEHDPAGRPTIYDRLPSELPRVMPVGRLDLNTEGLLLLTTDGALKRTLELPATGVERAYRARAYGQVSQAQLEDLIEGVEIDGTRYGPIDANLERRTGANVWIELILTEGKNREVRRVLDHLGLKVSRLIRTRYGRFVLGDLPAGEVGEVRQHDVVAFRNAPTAPPVEGRGGRPATDARAEHSRERSDPSRARADTSRARAGTSRARADTTPARGADTNAFQGRIDNRAPAGRAPAGDARATPSRAGRTMPAGQIAAETKAHRRSSRAQDQPGRPHAVERRATVNPPRRDSEPAQRPPWSRGGSAGRPDSATQDQRPSERAPKPGRSRTGASSPLARPSDDQRPRRPRIDSVAGTGADDRRRRVGIAGSGASPGPGSERPNARAVRLTGGPQQHSMRRGTTPIESPTAQGDKGPRGSSRPAGPERPPKPPRPPRTRR